MGHGWKEYRGETDKCPICLREGWCGHTLDGSVVHCMRVVSERPCKGGGWIHFTRPPDPKYAKQETPEPRYTDPADIRRTLIQWKATTPIAKLGELADSLGVSLPAIQKLGTARAIEHGAWAFPMSDEHCQWIGVRFRNDAGDKWALRGSKSGLFIPEKLGGGGPLIIVEGPTDTAAVLTWGFDAIGRPSCNSGNDLLLAYLKVHKRHVVILANQDEEKQANGHTFYPGQDGARLLADQIKWACTTLKVILPPEGIKDARAWLRAGGTRGEVETMIRNKTQWRVKKTA